MVTPADFFKEDEKVALAHITSAFGMTVKDQETFDDYCHTLQLAYDHDEMTRLLAMAAAVINSAAGGMVDKAADALAAMLVQLKAQGN